MTLLFIIILPLVALIGINHTEIAAIITSIGLLFAVVISVLCLFVLKFYRIINKREKLSYSSTTTSGVPGNTNHRGSSYVSGNESAHKSKSSYVEQSKKDEKEDKSEESSSTEKSLPLVMNKSTDSLLPANAMSSAVQSNTITEDNAE